MSLSLSEIAVPTYLRMLNNLSALLDKAEAHANENGIDLQEIVDARLAPDMGNLARQVQFASDLAKGGAARLAGVEPPSFPDTETTLPELRERIARTIAFVEGVDRAAIDAGADRRVELKTPNRTLAWRGQDFLLDFSLPNFLFHCTTAYALLRMKGVPLSKPDYLAGMRLIG